MTHIKAHFCHETLRKISSYFQIDRYNKNMTQDELKKLWEGMSKMIDDDLVDSLKNGTWGPISTYANNTIPAFPPLPSMNISPTDVDARGRYAYQEPEVDEQGTYYGYKILHKNPRAQGNCGCADCISLISPRYNAQWRNGELTADRVPSEKSMFGIHFTKRPDHPELRNYYGQFHGAVYSSSWFESSSAPSLLVKCALSGTIVETEQGFRAEHAQIIGVFINGNWQSYQDYQEHTRAYSRPNPEEEWERRIRYERDTKGNWTAYTDFSADP